VKKKMKLEWKKEKRSDRVKTEGNENGEKM
jgi:hypothetical protein